jgi:hypothetical protein
MNAPRYLPVAPVSRSICVAHSQVNIVLESHLMQQKLHAHLLAPELLRSMRIGILMGHPHLGRLRAMMAHNATFWRNRL